MKTLTALGAVCLALAAGACDGPRFMTEAGLDAHYSKIASVDNSLEPGVSGGVNTFNIPKIGPGLWRTTASTDGKSDRRVQKRCYKYPRSAFQALELTPVSELVGKCQTFKTWKGGPYTIEHSCDNGASQLGGTSTISGDLKTGYVVETRLTFQPRWRGMDRVSYTTVAERVGDC